MNLWQSDKALTNGGRSPEEMGVAGTMRRMKSSSCLQRGGVRERLEPAHSNKQAATSAPCFEGQIPFSDGQGRMRRASGEESGSLVVAVEVTAVSKNSAVGAVGRVLLSA